MFRVLYSSLNLSKGSLSRKIQPKSTNLAATVLNFSNAMSAQTHACVTRDGLISDKNSPNCSLHGEKQLQRNDILLRSPSSIMAPG